MEDRLAPAGLVNGDFAIGDPSSAGFGWSTRGNATVVGGVGQLAEGATAAAEFSQTFTVAPGMTSLSFTIVASHLASNGAGNPPDAFEAALLDAGTLQPLVGPPTNLSGTDAFLNIQQTGQVYYAPGVNVPGAGASGAVASLTTPTVVTVSLAGVPANTQATLFFDLIGFSPASSSVQVDNVSTSVNAFNTLALDPASDSGAVGDNLTKDNPVNLVGTTIPGATVALDTTGNGFTGGTTTADAQGKYTFSNVTLAEGANPLRTQSTSTAGTSIASLTVNVDTQPPTGTLKAPAPGSSTNQDLGYVDVQWTDPGVAGLDPASIGPSNVTITGVTVDQAEDLGNGLVRYRYNLDGDTLPTGTIQVVLSGGQVADRAGNVNGQTTQSFTLQAGALHAPLAHADAYSGHKNQALAVTAAQGVLANDTDPNGKPLSAVVVTGPAHGTLALASNGSFVYTPTHGFAGADRFTYKANDGTLDSNTVTVALTVVNNPPAALPDAYSAQKGTTLTVPAAHGVLANDTDPNGDSLAAVKVAAPAHGTLALAPNGSFTYTPAPGFSGTDSFTYKASDGTLDSNVATVTITVSSSVAQPLVAANDAYTTLQNRPLAVSAPGVLGNDTAPAGAGTSTAVLVAPTAHGTLTLQANGSFRYVPDANYRGPDSFTYREVAGAAASNVATVHLTITPAGTQLLPSNAYFNYLRYRRSLNPARFDSYHPQIGAILGLEITGLPSSPTRLIGPNHRFNIASFRALGQRNPQQLAAEQPLLSVLFQLESVRKGPAPAHLLPQTTAIAADRALYAQDPNGFDLSQPDLGAALAIEQIEAGVVPSVQLAGSTGTTPPPAPSGNRPVSAAASWKSFNRVVQSSM